MTRNEVITSVLLVRGVRRMLIFMSGMQLIDYYSVCQPASGLHFMTKEPMLFDVKKLWENIWLSMHFSVIELWSIEINS